jgi:hypothetical protein
VTSVIANANRHRNALFFDFCINMTSFVGHDALGVPSYFQYTTRIAKCQPLIPFAAAIRLSMIQILIFLCNCYQ